MLNIGVIGYGERIDIIVKKLLKSGKVHLQAVADIDCRTVRQRYLHGETYEQVHFYEDARAMLEAETLDGVCVGTRCDTHARYAALVAAFDLPLFLEKPVGVTQEDLTILQSALSISDRTVVSFPLRMSRMVTYVKELLDADKIGKIAHVQAYNNVPYGRVYYHHWYRDESITQGLFLQKATHDLDYIHYLLGNDRPVRVCAMSSKQVFTGDKPEGLLCQDCPEAETCPESPQNILKHTPDYDTQWGWCCYSRDVGNEDSGSCLVEYASGLHVAYSQNFVTRHGAARRGARLIGYKGTIEFDWYTETVTVYHHLENLTETHRFSGGQEGHFGGDDRLVSNFIGVMSGSETSQASLLDGVRSATLCLLCKQAAEQGCYQDIPQL